MPCYRCGKYGRYLINYETPRKYNYPSFSQSYTLLNKSHEESYFSFHLHLQGANINNPNLQMRLKRLSDFLFILP